MADNHALQAYFNRRLLTILTKHVKEAVTPPSKRVPERGIRPELDAFIVKSLAKKPGDRQADANTFITELEAAWGVARLITGTQPKRDILRREVLISE